MRRTLALFLVLGAALALEDPRARARELELEAEKALDEGRRADVLRLLKEAADMRAGKPSPNPVTAQASLRAAADLAEMGAALKGGDAAAALKAGRNAQGSLAAWAEDLEARERLLAGGEAPVEQRLDRLAKQIEELARRMGR